MTALRALIAGRQPFALLLFALALWTRLLVPEGYMIGSASGHGAPEIEICTGHGAAQLVAPDARQSGHKHDGKVPAAEHFCAFAAAGLALDLAQPVVSAALTPDALPLPVVKTGEPIPGRGLAAPPPPKTGPPTLI